MLKKRYMWVGLFFICTTMNAAPVQKVPTELMYLDKPIDPLCFFNLETKSNTIQLQDCGVQKEKYRIKDQNKNLIAKGYIGFNWQDPTIPTEGSSYYKFFPASDNQYWIYSINNSGGSGDFSEVSLAKRVDDTTLKNQHVDGGDRCNGGIEDVSGNNSQLKYSVNLTAFDLLALSNKNPHHLQAYDDLAACAVCCAAKAYYEVDANLKPNLLYVDLGNENNPSNMPDQGRYQACFNQLIASYVTRKQTKLDKTKLDELINLFNSTCISQKQI